MAETVVHFQIRMPPPMHERLASRARDEKSSLNALIVSLLSLAIERHAVPASASSYPAVS
jgi:predicted HicB family RNase H-like nuclease